MWTPSGSARPRTNRSALSEGQRILEPKMSTASVRALGSWRARWTGRSLARKHALRECTRARMRVNEPNAS
eukprot:6789012-Pyramimonas_sp.AAC.1